ncbi:hypothetical protein EVAR_101207_1 [Eumeta japonica]|uniref:Uncharacterized protein n=1 Tax=Eumeta variegata TaxID=151549 RepID=A0A4C2AEP9_EUMVA|nr:hypothetical protein EVAR_101207_1 [Eumeta japonica]
MSRQAIREWSPAAYGLCNPREVSRAFPASLILTVKPSETLTRRTSGTDKTFAVTSNAMTTGRNIADDDLACPRSTQF